jgi:hypothetical protein
MEVAHIGFEEPAGRVLLPCDAYEGRIEIQTIHEETPGSQKADVLASPTRGVKDCPALGIEPAQQTRYLRNFSLVIFEGRVNQVVELGR